MIFNDSIFTSTDAADFRQALLEPEGRITLLTVARTKCFEGRAVNGGVLVAVENALPDRAVRYVENHGRPPGELAAASVPAPPSEEPRAVGRSELWVAGRPDYLRLPHRPLFRPSAEALALLDRYEESAEWKELSRFEAEEGADWQLLSETRRLDRWKEDQRRRGFYDGLRGRARLVLLGLVVEGGQGLATADDRRFLAAIDGTKEADRARSNQARFEALVLARPKPAQLYRERRAAGRPAEDALLDVAERYTDRELGWPRTGLVRVAPPEAVRSTRLTAEEVAKGIAAGPPFVPFEKGDDSGEDGAARWSRENPLVIDWSPAAVVLLRRRASQAASYRKPRLQNEKLWGQGGVTWNRVASYLRCRLVPPGGIFSDKTPTIVPAIDWLSIEALLALLNAGALDFAVRTLLGSRMQIEIGDVRRLPIPVLSDDQAERLHDLGTRALTTKEALDRGERPAEPLGEIEAELDGYTRSLYGIRRDADLWVVR